jgi:hypothetical protein
MSLHIYYSDRIEDLAKHLREKRLLKERRSAEAQAGPAGGELE